MNILQLYPKPHLQTAGRVIDDEAVLMLADDSQINVLNSVGSRIYALADGSHSMQDIVDVIVAEFEVTNDQATTDVVEFVQGLVDNNVMVFTEA